MTARWTQRLGWRSRNRRQRDFQALMELERIQKRWPSAPRAGAIERLKRLVGMAGAACPPLSANTSTNEGPSQWQN
jgi:hypothetical protein